VKISKTLFLSRNVLKTYHFCDSVRHDIRRKNITRPSQKEPKSGSFLFSARISSPQPFRSRIFRSFENPDVFVGIFTNSMIRG